MMCLGPRDSFDRSSNRQVLRAYFACAKQPTSEEEFMSFWNSLSEMEKDYYLRANLPMLFYATKDV